MDNSTINIPILIKINAIDTILVFLMFINGEKA